MPVAQLADNPSTMNSFSAEIAKYIPALRWGAKKSPKKGKTMSIKLLAALTVIVALAATACASSAAAQTAREIRGASPYETIKNEPAPKLIVDSPIPEGLAHGFIQIQYRVQNVHIVPVFGKGALSASPRIGHLHITVDDLPWHWADASDSNTVDIVGLPPGKHKVLIELVDATHRVFPGQSITVSFVVPTSATHMH